MRLLGLSGSLRTESYNRALLRAAAQIAPEGVDFAVFAREKEVPVLDEDLELTPPSGVVHLRDAVAGADGVLFATPEYNQSIPGSTKNLVDWLSRSDHLAGKPVAIVGATTGPWGTRIAQSHLRQMLVSVGALVMPTPMLFLPHAAQAFDEDGRLVDEDVARRLTGVVAALAAWTRQTQQPPIGLAPVGG